MSGWNPQSTPHTVKGAAVFLLLLLLVVVVHDAAAAAVVLPFIQGLEFQHLWKVP
jgi:hypothetical protein